MPICEFWYGCSPVNLLHICRTPFPKTTTGGLLLFLQKEINKTTNPFLFLTNGSKNHPRYKVSRS